MRLKAVLLLLLLCLYTSVSAQNTTKWYYGWNADTGEVFAYTPEGEFHTLLENVEEVQSFTRISDETAFGLFYLDSSPEDVESLYYLTPDEARFIEPLFDQELLSSDDFTYAPMIFSEDYALFSASYARGVPTPGLLADFQAETVEVLGEYGIQWRDNTAAFSEDGHFLRYVRYASEEPLGWLLIEHTLATGEERVIFSNDSGYPTAVSDEYGEHWLARLPNQSDESIAFPFVLIDSSGESTPVAESTTDNMITTTLFEDRLFTWLLGCDQDCMMASTNLNGEDEHIYRAPGSGSTIIPLAQYEDGHLLILVGNPDEYYLLSEDQEPQLIGGYSLQNLGQPYDQALSSDGRFLLVLMDEDEYGVWDFEQQEFVIRNRPDDYVFALIFYGDGGFLISNGLLTFDLYRYADSSVIQLPEYLGVCFDVLADGDVLCRASNNEKLADGIYRYDLDEDTSMLLVEGPIRQMR